MVIVNTVKMYIAYTVLKLRAHLLLIMIKVLIQQFTTSKKVGHALSSNIFRITLNTNFVDAVVMLWKKYHSKAETISN